MSNATMLETSFDPALNMARQALYRFAALTLLDPRYSAWQQLESLRVGEHQGDGILADAASLVRESVAGEAIEFGVGELPAQHLDPASVWVRFPTTATSLNAAYESTFGLLVSAACPPYETEYIGGKYTFQRSNTLADISGYYRAFGLTTSRFNSERADHIVLELEFMAYLLGKERAAHEAPSSDQRESRLDVCRSAQGRFLEDHLSTWAALFAKLLQRENSGGFYDGVGQFLAALIPIERTLMGIAVSPPRGAPSQIEPPDACSGCALHGDSELGT